MASLLITASLGIYKSRNASPPAMNIFRDEDKRIFVAMPSIEGGTVSWTVPDTPRNRTLFKENCAPSGLFACETVDDGKPSEPFRFSAKGGSGPKGAAAPGKLVTVPATITPAPKASPKGKK